MVWLHSFDGTFGPSSKPPHANAGADAPTSQNWLSNVRNQEKLMAENLGKSEQTPF
jgi:hypothetical protein